MSDDAFKPLFAASAGRSLRVASIGECMVELAPAGPARQYRQSFAGDTFNTLWYLRQVAPHWAARFVSRVGDDRMSADMVAMMDEAGVETDHIGRDESRTVGLYLISLKDGERSFSYWRSQSAARLLAQDRGHIAAALQGVDVVFFSGITLAILDPASRGLVLAQLADERRAGKTIVFDPNLRPRLWPDTDAMREAVTAGASVSDMVLPSFDEEAAHFGDAIPGHTIARYMSAGARSVIVKNGPGAVQFVHEGQGGSVVPGPVTNVVDTTSAGDSFNAGVIAGLGQDLSIDDGIGLACAVAGQVIGQTGALCSVDLVQGEAS